MLELLFAFILTAAVVAVLFKPKQGGVIVMAIAMMVAFWYLGGLVDWHPMFFVYVVFAAAAIKIIDKAVGSDILDAELVLAIADMLLARWQGGRGGGGPPTGGGTGGGQEMRAERRMQTGPQRHPPRVFQDQDVDAAADAEEDEKRGNLEEILKDEFDR